VFSGVILPLSLMSAQDTGAAQALQLEVKRDDKNIEVQVIGFSPLTQQVRYSLELRGSSVSRHRATVGLSGNIRQTLSTMRMTADAPWCVILTVIEATGQQYEVSEGACAAAIP